MLFSWWGRGGGGGGKNLVWGMGGQLWGIFPRGGG